MNKLTFSALVLVVLAIYSCSSVAQYRFYYVTETSHKGNEVLAACAEGYHFASITELYNPSGLVYDVKADLGGLNKFDIGQGMAVGAEAWVRSAFSDDTETSCSVWTSADPTHTGTWAYLDYAKNGDAAFSPWIIQWFGGKQSCDTESRVYCVSDIIQPPPPEIVYCNGFESCPAPAQ